MIMLPGLHVVLGETGSGSHHMFIAAAMTVNVAVALPAAWRHNRSGAVRKDLLPTLMISAVLGMVTGVLVGNMVSGDALRVALGVFLLCYCAFNVGRIVRSRGEAEVETRGEVSMFPLSLCGIAGGFVGGALGLGGGVVLVPLLQLACRVGLKESVATSSAIISVTALIGATIKLSTLGGHGASVSEALMLAGSLAPMAVLGGVVGATLTHTLPHRAVRTVVTFLLVAAAAKLFRLF